MEIRQKAHEVYTEKNVRNFDITLSADFHYDDKFEIDKLSRIKEAFNRNESYFICLVGDIINENNIKDIDTLLYFIEEISKNSKTIISFGNHEMMNIIDDEPQRCDPNEFIKLLKRLKNVVLLNNEYYDEQQITFAGITNSFNYYKKEALEDFVTEANNGLKKPFNESNFNILLSHSPVNIIKAINEAQILNNCDMVLSGHNHNGLVPPFLEKLFKTRGLINHRNDLFPNNTKDNFSINDKKIIINGGITKFSSGSRFCNFNQCYYMDIDKIQVRSLKR